MRLFAKVEILAAVIKIDEPGVQKDAAKVEPKPLRSIPSNASPR